MFELVGNIGNIGNICEQEVAEVVNLWISVGKSSAPVTSGT